MFFKNIIKVLIPPYIYQEKSWYYGGIAIKFLRTATEVTVAFILSLLFSFFSIDFFCNGELCVEAAKIQSSPKIVVIDAGHGGEDCGAIGVNGVYEKDLNLAIGFEIGRALEERGITVVYTRTDDKLLYKEEENIKGIRKISDLKNRCKIAAEHSDAVFISIHMNSFTQSKYSGLQVYYSSNNESSLSLADSVQQNVKRMIQQDNNRKIKRGDGLYLMENIDNPAILIECGFLSNKAECEKLSEKEYQKQLSFAIVCGIIDYIE